MSRALRWKTRQIRLGTWSDLLSPVDSGDTFAESLAELSEGTEHFGELGSFIIDEESSMASDDSQLDLCEELHESFYSVDNMPSPEHDAFENPDMQDFHHKSVLMQDSSTTPLYGGAEITVLLELPAHGSR